MVDHETHTDERTELLAGELHERARTLNHLTQGPPGLTRPEATYTVLATWPRPRSASSRPPSNWTRSSTGNSTPDGSDTIAATTPSRPS
ncbi:hypothetical protein GCM10009727_73060 [Actinomadura napierensis]|uniref:Uncharacterized protein n=1 Tax=Actinomadura napierensis TaxID=267854 RepID=A0ABP5M6P7_9ACTN